MKGHGPSGHGPWGRSILRVARSNFGVAQMQIMQNLRVLTRVCFTVSCQGVSMQLLRMKDFLGEEKSRKREPT